MNRLLLAPLMLLASCGQSGNPDIQVSDAWARATAPGQSSAAAYMTIVNRGAGDDRLVAVTAAPPATAMLHATYSSEGVSSMQRMEDGADIPAGGTLELKPLGAHIMIMGLKQPLTAGSSLTLTLGFRHSGKQRVDVRILDATSTGPR